MEDEHQKYRLTLEQAEEQIKAVNMQAASPFTYIYLFIFDLEDKLIGVDLIRPDNPKPNLMWAELLSDECGKNNIYLIIKVKEFEDYFEGFIDSKGTVAKAKGFIKAWKDFDQKSGGDNQALKRFTIDFVNHSLGIPYRYSEEQLNADMQPLLQGDDYHSEQESYFSNNNEDAKYYHIDKLLPLIVITTPFIVLLIVIIYFVWSFWLKR